MSNVTPVVAHTGQNSDYWHTLRHKRLSSTRWADALGLKGNKAVQDLFELLRGESTARSFSFPAIEWGKGLEAAALEAYEKVTGYTVTGKNTVFAFLKEHPYLSASPDGLVGDDGLVEIKCPYTGTIPSQIHLHYVLQCHAQMLCTGRQWVDLAYVRGCLSRENATPALSDWGMAACVYIYRVPRNDALLDAILPVLTTFYTQVITGKLYVYEAPLSLTLSRTELSLLEKSPLVAGPLSLATPDAFPNRASVEADDTIRAARKRPSRMDLSSAPDDVVAT